MSISCNLVREVAKVLRTLWIEAANFAPAQKTLDNPEIHDAIISETETVIDVSADIDPNSWVLVQLVGSWAVVVTDETTGTTVNVTTAPQYFYVRTNVDGEIVLSSSDDAVTVTVNVIFYS